MSGNLVELGKKAPDNPEEALAIASRQEWPEGVLIIGTVEDGSEVFWVHSGLTNQELVWLGQKLILEAMGG